MVMTQTYSKFPPIVWCPTPILPPSANTHPNFLKKLPLTILSHGSGIRKNPIGADSPSQIFPMHPASMTNSVSVTLSKTVVIRAALVKNEGVPSSHSGRKSKNWSNLYPQKQGNWRNMWLWGIKVNTKRSKEEMKWKKTRFFSGIILATRPTLSWVQRQSLRILRADGALCCFKTIWTRILH